MELPKVKIKRNDVSERIKENKDLDALKCLGIAYVKITI